MSKKGNNNGRYCMFCGRRENEVSLLLQGMDACICAECVELAQGYLNEFTQEHASESKPGKIESDHKPMDIHGCP